MPDIYIRDTVSMKAAKIADRAAFEAEYPNGKFVFFDADTNEPVDDPDAEKLTEETDSERPAPPPRPVEDDEDDDL